MQICLGLQSFFKIKYGIDEEEEEEKRMINRKFKIVHIEDKDNPIRNNGIEKKWQRLSNLIRDKVCTKAATCIQDAFLARLERLTREKMFKLQNRRYAITHEN